MPSPDGTAVLRRGIDLACDVAPSYIRSLRVGRSGRGQFCDVETFCLFVGHPRSGHSLIGSLVNAHPDVVVSHELDVLRYVGLRFRREQLFHLILERDREFTRSGREVGGGFDYHVPDEWQGPSPETPGHRGQSEGTRPLAGSTSARTWSSVWSELFGPR